MSGQQPELVQFNLRVSAELKRRIERAAAAQGRSVNGEAVLRLERSLDQDPGCGPNGMILEQFAQVLGAASKAAGSNWTEDPAAWDLVRSTLDRLFSDWGCEPPKKAESISPAAAAAYDEWKASANAEGRGREHIEAEVRELELRGEVIGRSANEESRLEVLKAALNTVEDFSHLNAEDQQAVKRRIERDRMRTKFWRHIAQLFAGPPGREKLQPRHRKS